MNIEIRWHNAIYDSLEDMVRDHLTENDYVADESATEGLTFITSGPGSGWTYEFQFNDYAQAAAEWYFGLRGGGDPDCNEPGNTTYVIDPEDGTEYQYRVVQDEDDNWSVEPTGAIRPLELTIRAPNPTLNYLDSDDPDIDFLKTNKKDLRSVIKILKEADKMDNDWRTIADMLDELETD